MDNNRKTNWVSASDVGRAAYCPHYLELKRNGAKPSQQAVKAMAKGEVSHEAFNRQAEDRRCFIATHLYGIEHPKTCILRQYRDEHLATNRAGKALILIYYALSPCLVRVCIKVPVINRMIMALVDRITRRIEEQNKRV